MAASKLEEPGAPPPSAFCCPISLELMTDPVTLSSGITYDRSSIQSWLAAGHLTCPVTRQPLLPYPFFIPNHTLLRIIRSWSHSHSGLSARPALPSPLDTAVCKVRIGHLCTGALFKLGLLKSIAPDQLLPHDEALPLLISLIDHYGADACQGNVLAERTCEDALATLSILPLPSHQLSRFSDPLIISCITHFLYSAHRPTGISSALLLTKIISQHPSQKNFFKTLSLESLSAIARGLAQILSESMASTFLAQDILQSLCLLCKSGRTAMSSLATDASTTTIVYAALEQILHNSTHRGELMVSEKALVLLEIVASFAEGRDAIASHAFAVPAIARFLERSVSEAAMVAAVVILWKMCCYSSWESVRRQAMEACVPSKLVLLMQTSHLGNRGKRKAGALVRLLIEG